MEGVVISVLCWNFFQEKVRQSLSKSGTPHDNAVMEHFFRSINKHKTYQNIDELRAAVEEYINYYNGIRPMKTRENMTPNEFERRYFEKMAC